MGTKQVLPIRVRIEKGVKAMKGNRYTYISISKPMRLSLRGCVMSTWEDVSFEVTVSSVGIKRTFKTHLVRWSHIYHD